MARSFSTPNRIPLPGRQLPTSTWIRAVSTHEEARVFDDRRCDRGCLTPDAALAQAPDALLVREELDEYPLRPTPAIGAVDDECLQSGNFHGWLSLPFWVT